MRFGFGLGLSRSNFFLGGLPSVATAPEQVTTFTAIPGGANEIVFNITPPGDGGSAITGYEFRLGSGIARPIATATSTGTGVPSGTRNISVRAVNAIGDGAWSESVVVVVSDGTASSSVALEDAGDVFRITIPDTEPLSTAHDFIFDGVTYSITRQMLVDAATNGSQSIEGVTLSDTAANIADPLSATFGIDLVPDSGAATIAKATAIDGVAVTLPRRLITEDMGETATASKTVNAVTTSATPVVLPTPAFSFDSLYLNANPSGFMVSPSPTTAFSDTGATTGATINNDIASYTDLSGNGLTIAASSTNTDVQLVAAGSGYAARTTGIVNTYVAAASPTLNNNMAFAGVLRLDVTSAFTVIAGNRTASGIYARFEDGSTSPITVPSGTTVYIDGVEITPTPNRDELAGYFSDQAFHTLIFLTSDIAARTNFATEMALLSTLTTTVRTEAGVEHGRMIFCDSFSPSLVTDVHAALMAEVT